MLAAGTQVDVSPVSVSDHLHFIKAERAQERGNEGGGEETQLWVT